MLSHGSRGVMPGFENAIEHKWAAKCLLTVILSASIGSAQAQTAITLVGTGTYPQDVQAIQTAVDTYDVVTLRGPFNFGQAVYGVSDTGEITGTPAGSVYITRPNVTLQADETTGATLAGGGAPFSADWFFDWPVINVVAPGVTVRSLSMTGSVDTGVFVMGGSQMVGGQTITIEKNSISTAFCPLLLEFTGGVPIVLDGNTLADGSEGIFADWTGYSRDQTGQIIQYLSPLQITGNDITLAPTPEVEGHGILVRGWSVWRAGVNPVLGYPPPLPPGVNPADWGDNGPVTIRGNTLTLTAAEWQEGIVLGQSAMGLNHAIAIENTIRGIGYWGFVDGPYGHDNEFIENDLSGLTTEAPQVIVMARETTVAGNVFGRILNGAETPALFLWSVNWHPLVCSPLDTPMPLPIEKCTISDNDYTRTGLPGWPNNGWGAILLASDVDVDYFCGVGTEVRYNLIKETGKFPRGTGGPSKQVLEFNLSTPPLVHDNRIVGLPANHVQDPGIGQRIKELKGRFIQRETGKKGKFHP